MHTSQILSISLSSGSVQSDSPVQQAPCSGVLPNSYPVSYPVSELQAILKKSSDLSNEHIKKIKAYVQHKLPLLVENAQKTQTNIHLRPLDTHLVIPLEINKEGQIYLPLKSYGREVGQGAFSQARLAIFLTSSSCTLVVHSRMVLQNSLRAFFATNEVWILNKIRKFQETHPQAIGLLHFYGSTTYPSKISSEAPLAPFKDNSYSTDLSLEEKRGSYPKRALFTELYPASDLESNLENLTFFNKLKITYAILQGLYHLHVDLKIFHSDLKLTNIFIGLGDNVQAVIGDFGFACDLTVKEDCFFKAGDATYMAPEIKGKIEMGHPIDESILACDIYSMGLLLNQLFQPNQGNLKALIDQMLHTDPLKRPCIKEVLLKFNYVLKKIYQLAQTAQINKSSHR